MPVAIGRAGVPVGPVRFIPTHVLFLRLCACAHVRLAVLWADDESMPVGVGRARDLVNHTRLIPTHVCLVGRMLLLKQFY